jgi:hypothetical protein
MESYSNTLYAALTVILIGALLQTTNIFPSFFDKYFDSVATKITVYSILLVLSFGFVMFILQQINKTREGFQTEETALDDWKQLTKLYEVDEVCSMKKRIVEKMLPVEKGVAPNELSDVQAQERVDSILSKGLANGTVNCELVAKVNEAKDIDSFFVVVQEVPDTFLMQVHDTAERFFTLLQKQYDEVMNSLDKTKEGFVDASVGICSPEVVEERRKFLREKKLDEQAQKCLLPEEVPFESKNEVAKNKIKKIQSTYDAYIRLTPGKLTVGELMLKSKDLEGRLEEKKKQAESGALLNQ